jgi:hypothetical protein
MNLLPFVMIIVFVLGMFSLSQFQRNNSLEKEKNAYIAYFKGLRESRNGLEDMAYVNARNEISHSTTSSKTSSSEQKGENEEKDDIQKRPFFRERKIGWPSGRLNLSSLLDDTKNSSTLKNICIEYLRALYGHKDFFPKDPKPLLDSIITKLKTDKDSVLLHELKLDDPKMHDIFYKMLRGTHTYNLKNEGYPPFDHFFTFEKGCDPPMNFHSANEVFLEVALGENVAKELIKKEKESVKTNALSSPLSKDEINDILKNIFPNPMNLFNFNISGTQRNPEMYVDDQTKITVRIE